MAALITEGVHPAIMQYAAINSRAMAFLAILPPDKNVSGKRREYIIANAIPIWSPDSASTCIVPAAENDFFSSFPISPFSPMAIAHTTACDCGFGTSVPKCSAIFSCTCLERVSMDSINLWGGSVRLMQDIEQMPTPQAKSARCEQRRKIVVFFLKRYDKGNKSVTEKTAGMGEMSVRTDAVIPARYAAVYVMTPLSIPFQIFLKSSIFGLYLQI